MQTRASRLPTRTFWRLHMCVTSGQLSPLVAHYGTPAAATWAFMPACMDAQRHSVIFR